ncbi:MAG: hypothetical protein EOP09_01435, partial [Proteobacteria bacterium]
MKFVFGFVLLALSSFNVQADDQFFRAAKYFLFNTTQKRVEGYTQRNIRTICNAREALTGLTTGHTTDTMTYYVAFEMLENPALARRLSDEIGPFAYASLL